MRKLIKTVIALGLGTLITVFVMGGTYNGYVVPLIWLAIATPSFIAGPKLLTFEAVSLVIVILALYLSGKFIDDWWLMAISLYFFWPGLLISALGLGISYIIEDL